jgi:predicted  nucleic acid-binding Zn-ribbon protein
MRMSLDKMEKHIEILKEIRNVLDRDIAEKLKYSSASQDEIDQMKTRLAQMDKQIEQESKSIGNRYE